MALSMAPSVCYRLRALICPGHVVWSHDVRNQSVEASYLKPFPIETHQSILSFTLLNISVLFRNFGAGQIVPIC